jgi:hypothetical protein
MGAKPKRWRIAGITIPLGPIGVRVAVHRRGVVAVAVVWRRGLR